MTDPLSSHAIGPPSLVAGLRSQAALRLGQRAFTFLADGEVESERLSYRALDRRSRAVAAVLVRQEGAVGRVLLLFPPGLNFVIAFFGCLYAGAVRIAALAAGQPELDALLSLCDGMDEEEAERRFAATGREIRI